VVYIVDIFYNIRTTLSLSDKYFNFLSAYTYLPIMLCISILRYAPIHIRIYAKTKVDNFMIKMRNFGGGGRGFILDGFRWLLVSILFYYIYSPNSTSRECSNVYSCDRSKLFSKRPISHLYLSNLKKVLRGNLRRRRLLF